MTEKKQTTDSGLTKAEQKRQLREQELIDLALVIAVEEGFAALTMEKLTARSNYSKGTIYNHFANKEDCLSAITHQAGSQIFALFSKAFEFPGRLREKALAVHFSYYLFSIVKPELFMALIATKTQAVRDKSSAQRNCLCDQMDKSITDMSDSMMRLAIDQGDLKLRASIPFESLSFANWAHIFGVNTLISSVQGLAMERMDKDSLVLHSINLILDGMNYHPLSDEFDYQTTWNKLKNEYFAQELSQAKQ